MTSLPPHCTCISCGLAHSAIDARGVYYCPNPLCSVSGASWFPRGLASCTGDAVDGEEWLREGLRAVDAEIDPVIRAAGYRSALLWAARAPEYRAIYEQHILAREGGIGEGAL